jgi:hypothetical protein
LRTAAARTTLLSVTRRRLPIPRDLDFDLDEGPSEPAVTAQPTQQPVRELEEGAEEKLVPPSNVGGAAPTPLGCDSGGDLPGSEDDLANLAEPEPPEAPEVGAVHVRSDAGSEPHGGRRRR